MPYTVCIDGAINLGVKISQADIHAVGKTCIVEGDTNDGCCQFQEHVRTLLDQGQPKSLLRRKSEAADRRHGISGLGARAVQVWSMSSISRL